MTARVVLVGPAPPPPGGIASHVVDLGTLLARRGVNVSLLYPRRSLGFFGALAARAPRAILHLHIHGHSRQSWLMAAGCAHLARSVLTIHSGLAPRFIEEHRRLVRFACRGYRALICVSEPVRSALFDAGVDGSRLWVAPAFLEEALASRLLPAGLSAIRREHATVISAMAAPGAEYGMSLLLRAFELVRAERPSAALVLFGPLAPRKLFARAGLYQLGPLAREEGLGLMKASDVFVRPTFADGDSTSTREALALGTRVVASDVAPRPSGVRLFRTGDPASLSEAISESLAAPPPRLRPSGASHALFAVYRRVGLAAELCAASEAL
jgi:glycosyltransferase involved in cell wall biosynthesis